MYHCYIGKSRTDIQKAYDNAMEQGLYDNVECKSLDETTGEIQITVERGYAATNCYEYFAQIAEAYFGYCNYISI